MQSRISRGIVVLSLVAAAIGSQATILGFGQSWYISYEQLGNVMPGLPTSTAVVSTVSPDDPNDFLSGTWEGPNGFNADYIYTPALAITYSPDFGSNEAAFLAAYPAGNYETVCTGGNYLGQSATVPSTTFDFANEIPWFTGTTYSSMQLCPAGVARSVTWSPFTTDNVVPDKTQIMTLVGYTVPGDNYYASFAQTATGTTIPGTALTSGRHYYLELDYVAGQYIPNLGFGGSAPGGWSFHRRTGFFFDVKSSPGTVAGQLSLENFYRPVGEIIDWEVINTADVVLDSGTFAIGYSNYFAFDTTAVGSYRVRFKGRHWLSKVSAILPIGAGVNGLQIALTNGDVNGDNIVDVADYGRLAQAFDATPGDGNYDEPADLDGSSLVDIADYSYLAAAFDGVGE